VTRQYLGQGRGYVLHSTLQAYALKQASEAVRRALVEVEVGRGGLTCPSEFQLQALQLDREGGCSTDDRALGLRG